MDIQITGRQQELFIGGALIALILGFAVVGIYRAEHRDQPAATHEVSYGLPPIPPTMGSVLGPVPVVLVDSLPDGADGSSTLGESDVLHRKVMILKGLALEVQWQIFGHEACHFSGYDFGAAIGGDAEERFCDAVSTQRLLDLRASLAARQARQ